MTMLGIQASLQFPPMEPLYPTGQSQFDLLVGFGPHHHDHRDCAPDPGGDCHGGGQNQLERTGRQLVHQGEQLVRLGEQLMRRGDFRQGMQLIREGTQIEKFGARLEEQGTDPCGGDGPSGQYGDGGHGNCSDQLTVNGNSVDTGRYTIAASTDGGGTLTVTDNTTGKNFKVWGDPHITTDNGATTDFQHAPATFVLPDGTKITVDPTNNSGVNYINNVTITKGNNAVEMTGFHTGNLQTEAKPGEGRYLDRTTPDGTVLHTENGQIDELVLPNGTELKGNNVKNIDGYANDSTSSQQISQIEQEIAQLEQELSQIEQGMDLNSLCTSGFMSNPLQDDYIG